MSDLGPEVQGWHPLSSVPEADFVEARLQLHWASQVLAAAGDAHVEKMDDDGQSNLGWVDGMQLFAGRYLEGEPAGFFSLTPSGFLISFHEPGGEPLSSLELAGKTMDAVKEWAEATVAERTGNEKLSLTLRDYDMPGHAVSTGAAFGGVDRAALEQIHHWSHDANLVIRDLRAAERGMTMPRLWPHHFDMGAVKSLEEHGNALEGRSVGIGLSLGDARQPLPYWYVAPWPIRASLPSTALPHGGTWSTEGFIGAELNAAAVWAEGVDQESAVREFLEAAIAACAAS